MRRAQAPWEARTATTPNPEIEVRRQQGCAPRSTHPLCGSSGASNRTEAKAERDEFLAKQRRGEIAPPTKITFAEVATEFLASFEALVAAGERAERTLERYRSALDL